ncbi:MAG: FxsA family protein [Verrucomicrobiota bacterium]
MGMMFWLFILFIGLPWIELWLLLRIGAVVGAGPTIGLIILTGVIGASLTRLEGARALGKIRNSTARGEVPGTAIVDAMLIFAAGLVLITPGFLTDVTGFLLLIPQTRALIRALLVRQLKKHAVYQFNVNVHTQEQGRQSPGGRQSPDPDVIDVEAHEVPDTDSDRD